MILRTLVRLGECRRTAARLGDLVRGDLPPAEAARARKHLSACQECADELAFVEKSAAATTLLGHSSLETGRGWEEIRQRLGSQPPAEANSRRISRFVIAYGAAVVVMTVLFLLYTHGSKVVALQENTPATTAQRAPNRSGQLPAPSEPRIATMSRVKVRPVGPNRSVRIARRVPRVHPLQIGDVGPNVVSNTSCVHADEDRSTIVDIRRSSELGSTQSTAPVSLVSGTMPSQAGPDDLVPVTGSAPASGESANPVVSAETAPDEDLRSQ